MAGASQYDLYYIKQQSLALDLLILLHTVKRMVFLRGSQGGRKVQRTTRSRRDTDKGKDDAN